MVPIHREQIASNKPRLASVNPLCLFKPPQSGQPRADQAATRVGYTLGGLRGPTDPGPSCGSADGTESRVGGELGSRSMWASPIVFPESAAAAVQCYINAAEASQQQPATESAAARSSSGKHRGGGGGDDDAHIRRGASVFVGNEPSAAAAALRQIEG